MNQRDDGASATAAGESNSPACPTPPAHAASPSVAGGSRGGGEGAGAGRRDLVLPGNAKPGGNRGGDRRTGGPAPGCRRGVLPRGSSVHRGVPATATPVGSSLISGSLRQRRHARERRAPRTNKGVRAGWWERPFGGLAIPGGPMALRPRLAAGLPLSRNHRASGRGPWTVTRWDGNRDGAAEWRGSSQAPSSLNRPNCARAERDVKRMKKNRQNRFVHPVSAWSKPRAGVTGCRSPSLPLSAVCSPWRTRRLISPSAARPAGRSSNT